MYAIVESCGKQYKVAEKDIVFFEKLDVEEGKKITFDKVILVSDNDKIQVGNPYVKGVEVSGTVLAHGKGKKIIVFKMKAKKNYRRKQGHRQPYTKVEIQSIKTGAAKEAKVEKVVTEKVETSEAKPVVKKETKPATEKKEAVKKTTTTTTKKATTTKAATAKKEEVKE